MFSVTLSPPEAKAAEIVAQLLLHSRVPDAQGAESAIHPRVKFQLMLGGATQLDAFASRFHRLTVKSPASSLISVDLPAPLRPQQTNT